MILGFILMTIGLFFCSFSLGIKFQQWRQRRAEGKLLDVMALCIASLQRFHKETNESFRQRIADKIKLPISNKVPFWAENNGSSNQGNT